MPPPRGPGARIACLLVPDLPLAALLRAHPELAGKPVAVTAGGGPRAEILSVSPEAARFGVRPRTTLVQGRAACAELLAHEASLALQRAARAALLDAALSTSPRVEPAPPAHGLWATETALVVDASGTAALFHSETGFASALVERTERLGLQAVVAVAGSAEVARIAARQLLIANADQVLTANADQRRRPTDARPEQTLVIPPGADAAFLAPLPLELLGPDDALADSLTRFGLRCVADLVRIPERSLTTRLGAVVQPLLVLARGASRAPPPQAPEPSDFAEAQELEVPVDRIEPLLFVLRGMLSRLATRLDCRGLAVADLELRLDLDGRARDARRIGVAAPTLDVSVLLRLVGLSLESHPPGSAIEVVHVSTRGAAVRGDQLDFFRPPGPTPAVLSRTLAELTSLCGEGRVGAPAVADSHRPDAYDVTPFSGPSSSSPSAASPRTPSAAGQFPGGADAVHETPPAFLAVRALRPPVAAQVRAPGGTPEHVRSALANGDVLRAAGPWRTTGHWWSDEERYAFDHFDVHTSDGLVVRLRFDWKTRRWQIDGVYD